MIFVLFLISGLLIFVIGSGYYSLFPTNKSLLFKIFLVILFLIPSLLLEEGQAEWRQVFQAFFVASGANLIGWFFGPRIVRSLRLSDDRLQGISLGKLIESCLVISTILLILFLNGNPPSSIYLEWGDLRWGLIAGLGTGLVFLGIAFLQTKSLGISRKTLASLAPWIVIFVLANAAMEELWFRAIFLKRFEAFVGPAGSLILTALIFTTAHIGATYLSRKERLQFLVILFPLALWWGYLMQRSGGILGSILSHAGADLLIVNGYIEALQDENE